MAMVTGRVRIFVNGQYVYSKPGAKLSFSDTKRTAVLGNEVHGYAEEATAPRVEFTLSHMANTRLDTFKNHVDESITFACDTGRTYALNNAWCTGEIELTAGQGEVSLAYEGKSVTEL